MQLQLRKYFIPHAGNNYHPHMLHTKRAVFYAAFFTSLKVIIILFVLALPARVFVLPDILAAEQKKILALTNDVRAQKSLPKLVEAPQLDDSSQRKADNMAKLGYFSHVSPDNRTVSDWIKDTGYVYRVAGENLAMGFSTAEDVVDAWIKSPTHYANLIDTDFHDIGVGLQTGSYGDTPTVYVAEHFGTRIKPPVVGTTAKLPAPKSQTVTPVSTTVSNSGVLSAKVTAPEKPVLNNERSRMYWQENNGATLLIAHADISGAVESAVVTVGNYPIELKKLNGTIYTGKFYVNQSADDFFRVIIPPSIHIVGVDGSVTDSQIAWYNVKVVSPTPMQTYERSRDALSPLTSLFSIARIIYLIAIIFFSLAILMNIVIEIKKQHPHVILQTLGLIAMLTLFYFV